MQFTDHGIEGVVPPELLPPDVRSKFHAKPSEKTKRAKKEEVKGAAAQPEDNQVVQGKYLLLIICLMLIS